MSNKTGKKLAIGAVVGVVTGYVAGILTAPKSGKETRADIKNTSAKVIKESEARLKELNDDLSKLLDRAATKTKDLRGRSKQKLSALVKNGKEARTKAKEVLGAMRSGDAKDPELKKAVRQASEAKKHLSNYLKSSK